MVWLTDAMAQVAMPEVPDVALQLWAEVPDPKVNVTTRPAMSEPAAEVSSPDTESAWPFTAEVEPV